MAMCMRDPNENLGPINPVIETDHKARWRCEGEKGVVAKENVG